MVLGCFEYRDTDEKGILHGYTSVFACRHGYRRLFLLILKINPEKQQQRD
jgi:hypothetical protein